MNKKQFLISALILMMFFSCTTQKNITYNSNPSYELSKQQEQLLDSILQKGLDYEALYTIIGKIKPMSSVVSFNFPIANIDSSKKTKGDVIDLDAKQKYIDKIERIQTSINSLNYPDIKFVLIPYCNAYGTRRTIQLSVVRLSLFDSVLQKKASFFSQFGFVAGADPAVVITTIENSDRYERLRAYGYLFGYPDYAIDFFVKAFESHDKTHKFVKRNFFQIPTYATKEGAFVYAYPKNYTPNNTDSTLYFKAGKVLKQYKVLRKNYLNKDSSLQSKKLLDDFFFRPKKTK